VLELAYALTPGLNAVLLADFIGQHRGGHAASCRVDTYKRPFRFGDTSSTMIGKRQMGDWTTCMTPAAMNILV